MVGMRKQIRLVQVGTEVIMDSGDSTMAGTRKKIELYTHRIRDSGGSAVVGTRGK